VSEQFLNGTSAREGASNDSGVVDDDSFRLFQWLLLLNDHTNGLLKIGQTALLCFYWCPNTNRPTN